MNLFNNKMINFFDITSNSLISTTIWANNQRKLYILFKKVSPIIFQREDKQELLLLQTKVNFFLSIVELQCFFYWYCHINKWWGFFCGVFRFTCRFLSRGCWRGTLPSASVCIMVMSCWCRWASDHSSSTYRESWTDPEVSPLSLPCHALCYLKNSWVQWQ